MRQVIVTAFLVMASAAGAFAQGQVYFNNRVLSGDPLFAPIYGVNPIDPSRRIVGQGSSTPLGPPIPVGTSDYSGCPLLAGSGFTVQLWGGPQGSLEHQLQLCAQPGTPTGTATTTFRTGSGAGILMVLSAIAAVVPNAPDGPGSRAVLQFRAWENQNGTVTSWAMVLSRPDIARGLSLPFTPNYDLGGGPTQPPNLNGLESFNLFLAVPEPSVLLLGVLGLALSLWRVGRRTRA